MTDPAARPKRRRLAVAAAMVLACIAGCGRDRAERNERALPSAAGGDRAAPPVAAPAFEEVARELGVDFEHRTGSLGTYPMPAIMGGGLCVFDADDDGDLDLYFVDGGNHGAGELAREPESSGSRGHRFFRRGADGRYHDDTVASGLGGTGHGMGCATADVDNDGDLDVFVSAFGRDAFYRNLGAGRFREDTAAAGLGDRAWSASAAFLDYDRDGWLDLFVTRYVDFDPARACALEGGRPDYCGPAQFAGVSDLLYRNRGDGTFEERGREAGIASAELRGLGVVAADFDDDGWVDLYVANDSDPNNLWINQRDGTFRDDAILLGVAYNRYGVAEAGMGIATGDLEDDGDLDLLVTHLIEETNTLYENRGALGFEDVTASSGIGLPSLPYTGFGAALFDADLDGDLDVAVANGAVKVRLQALGGRPEWFWNEYAEPNLLLLREDALRFLDATPAAGAFGRDLDVSRGLVAADLDGDGDLDLVTGSVEGPARIYRNPLQEGLATKRRWLEVRTLLKEHRREALGAKVAVVTTTRRRSAHALPPTSYLCGGHARVHLALIADERVEAIEVRWPDGGAERFAAPGAEGVLVVERWAGDAL